MRENEAVDIRLATPADAAAIADIYRPIVERTTITFDLAAPGEEAMRSRIEQATTRYPWLVATEGGDALGFAYSNRHRDRAGYDPSADVGIYLRDDARGRGIGTTLYDELLKRLAAAGTFHRAFAGIALPNDASVALHKKHGFTLVGVYHEVGRKFGRWIDVAWWERALG